MTTRPTLAEIRSTWPATVSVPDACEALGISRSCGYALAKIDAFPCQVISVGNRRRVVTSSLITLLEGRAGDAA